MSLFACTNDSEQIDTLTQENSALRSNYQNQLLKTKEANAEADSVKTVAYKLQNQLAKLEKKAVKKTSANEEAIEQLVHNLHKGWASMFKTKNTNDLLQYFLPKYTTSTVRINTENIPSVQRSNDSNFEEHLKELLSANNLSISLGETKFLYTEVKGDIFVTSYRTRIRVYDNNQQVHTSSLVTQLAGENNDGWKVGNYSWVTFNYE